MTTMNTMEQYSVDQRFRNYIHELIVTNDTKIYEYLDEEDIEFLNNYAQQLMKAVNQKKTDQERIDLLFDGVMIFIMMHTVDNKNQ